MTSKAKCFIFVPSFTQKVNDMKKVTVDAQEKNFTNLRSEKGWGQVVKSNPSLGWEMTFQSYTGETDGGFFQTKTEAKNALVKKLTA